MALESAPPLLVTLTNSEVVRWLREPCIHDASTLEEVRLYIQSKVYDFPIITEIARDFLAIPATLVPSKRVFSLTGNLILKKRTRIISKNVRYVLCLRS